MTVNRLILSLLAVALCGGCDSDPVDVSPPPSLLPLEIGNRWVFERTITDGMGTVVSVEPDTVSVVSDTVVAGDRWFALAGSSGSSQLGFGGYNTVRPDGVWFRSNLSTPEYLQYAYPTEPGQSYPYAPHRYAAEATVVSVSEDAPRSLVGILYAVRFDSLRAPPRLAFSESIPPMRRVLVPEVGFAEYQTQVWQVGDDGRLTVYRAQTWRLVRFEPADGTDS